MFALGHSRDFAVFGLCLLVPLIATNERTLLDVSNVPLADIRAIRISRPRVVEEKVAIQDRVLLQS
jgi:hypothetical protein